MKRPVNKSVIGIFSCVAVIASVCSTVYADAVWEPTPRRLDGSVAMFLIALLVLAVAVGTVILIRRNWRKKGNPQNGPDMKTDIQDKESNKEKVNKETK